MANQKHLALLAQGIAAWNQWKGDTSKTLPGLRWNFQRDADLDEADLSGADLSGINLGNVSLCKTNFSAADLVEACLVKSEPLEANFTGANMHRADLHGANASGANFSNTNLSDANLSDADLSMACFQNANLSGADLSRSDLREACFLGANLSEANLSGAYLSKEFLQGANLRGANLSGVHYRSLFPGKQIRQAKKAGALVRSVNLNQQKAKNDAKGFSNRKPPQQGIIIFPRVNTRTLLGLLASFIMALAGICVLEIPGKPGGTIIGVFAILFSGLGMVSTLLQILLQLLNRIPLLIINDQGLEYFCVSLFKRIEPEMAGRDIKLTWKEIGAIGIVKGVKTNYFVVYICVERWHTHWTPHLRIAERLLPISVQQLIVLIQERYQRQLAANCITTIELLDDTDTDRWPI